MEVVRRKVENQIYGADRAENERTVEFMDPLLRVEPSLNDFCYGISLLQDLSRQGSWRSILEKVTQARKLSLLQKPHEHLSYLAYNVLALTKLRRHGEAAEELATIDDFDSPEYKYENHPSHYPGKSGSMVPFSLRWLHAELPHRLGQKQETMDRLYKLLDFIEGKLGKGDPGKPSTDSSGVESPEPPFPLMSPTVADSETQQEPPASASSSSSSSSSVPFPFTCASITNAETNGSRLSECDSASPSDFTNSSAINQVSDGGVPFESLKLTDGAVFEKGQEGVSQQLAMDPRKSTDRMPLAGGSATLPDGLGEGFCEFVGSRPVDQKMPLSPRTKDKYGALGTSLGRWHRRKEFVVNSIMSHHLSEKEFNVAMKWLQRLLERNPSDPVLLSKLGYVQMQLGDLSSANQTFSRIEAMLSQGEVPCSLTLEGLQNMVNRNKALQHLVVKDYTGAIREYEEALDRDPTDIVATNNKALCLMYSRDLLGSIKVLENALERAPVAALNENVVLNLCSMYELAFVSNVETKRTLSSWIMQIAPEDFDLSCTRL